MNKALLRSGVFVQTSVRAYSRKAPPISKGIGKLLPPLQLYKRIVKVHNKMPPGLSDLGKSFVKSEFKQHKDIDNAYEIVAFLSQWQQYLLLLENNRWKDSELHVETIDKMSDHQIEQLYELMLAAKGKPPAEKPKKQ